jgi:hypothetical protein
MTLLVGHLQSVILAETCHVLDQDEPRATDQTNLYLNKQVVDRLGGPARDVS